MIVFHSVYVNIITILLSTLQILPGPEHNEIQWRIRVLCNSLEQPLFESHRGWASTFLFCFVLSSRRSCPFHFHLSVLCGERLEGIGSTCLLSIPIYIFFLMKLKLAAIAFIFWNTIFLSVVKTNISKIHWCKCWLWSSSYDSWKVSS